MEVVEARDPEIWRDLLGEARYMLAQQLSDIENTQLVFPIRKSWSALSAAKPEAFEGPQPQSSEPTSGGSAAACN
jgi:hypothetical protein